MPNQGRRSRPLGSVRGSLTGIESIPKLPPLGPTSQSLDRTYEGIHGNAMNIPPSKGSPDRRGSPKIKTPVTSERNTSSSRSAGSKSDDSATVEAKRELREALSRERLNKSQIADLQRTIEELRAALEEKEHANKTLQEQLEQHARAESHYKELYEKEVVRHAETREKLVASQALVGEKEKEITELNHSHQEKIKELNIKTEKRVLEVEKAKDAEIAARDEKLKRLKNQMADALRGNSWERQQQLDELSKELTRAHEEVDMLRTKLRAMAKNGLNPGVAGCANCESLSTRIQHLERVIIEKDKIIRELKGLGSRFEKQLSQKETLNQLVNDRKT